LPRLHRVVEGVGILELARPRFINDLEQEGPEAVFGGFDDGLFVLLLGPGLIGPGACDGISVGRDCRFVLLEVGLEAVKAVVEAGAVSRVRVDETGKSVLGSAKAEALKVLVTCRRSRTRSSSLGCPTMGSSPAAASQKASMISSAVYMVIVRGEEDGGASGQP